VLRLNFGLTWLRFLLFFFKIPKKTYTIVLPLHPLSFGLKDTTVPNSNLGSGDDIINFRAILGVYFSVIIPTIPLDGSEN
jgi:hypothetical protein